MIICMPNKIWMALCTKQYPNPVLKTLAVAQVLPKIITITLVKSRVVQVT